MDDGPRQPTRPTYAGEDAPRARGPFPAGGLKSFRSNDRSHTPRPGGARRPPVRLLLAVLLLTGTAFAAAETAADSPIVKHVNLADLPLIQGSRPAPTPVPSNFAPHTEDTAEFLPTPLPVQGPTPFPQGLRQEGSPTGGPITRRADQEVNPGAASGLIVVLILLLLLVSRTGRGFVPSGTSGRVWSAGGRKWSGWPDAGGGTRFGSGGFGGGGATGCWKTPKTPRIRKTGNLFTPQEEERVESAIRGAGVRTSGTIVPLVVARSHTYPHLPFLGGMFGLLAASLASAWWPPGVSLLFLVVAQAVGFTGGFLCFLYLPMARRALLPRKTAEETVFERAVDAFRTLELNLAEERNGILILVSLLEHRVQVLAGSGINARVKPGTWNEVVQIVLKGIREGDLCEGLFKAIERCAAVLEQDFPRRGTSPS